jgi:hypothetical protein
MAKEILVNLNTCRWFRWRKNDNITYSWGPRLWDAGNLIAKFDSPVTLPDLNKQTVRGGDTSLYNGVTITPTMFKSKP